MDRKELSPGIYRVRYEGGELYSYWGGLGWSWPAKTLGEALIARSNLYYDQRMEAISDIPEYQLIAARPRRAQAQPKASHQPLTRRHCGDMGQAGGYPFSTLPGSDFCDDCVDRMPSTPPSRTKVYDQALTGSEKQIAWANSIRAKAVAGAEVLLQAVNDYLRNNSRSALGDLGNIGCDYLMDFYTDALDEVLSNTSASFWIDNRVIAMWEKMTPNSPLAYDCALSFMREQRDRKLELYKEVYLRGLQDNAVQQAIENAKGTVNSWGEWESKNKEIVERFCSGSRLDELSKKESTGTLTAEEETEYNALIVEFAAIRSALQDFVERSGGDQP